ncbi:trimeric intracellular cation channel family protein [Zavarzinia sp. CC-PAN008]|uniref:trimeric intracellular cation channel family protein n=1 Tax=Zavarzinia sp. CC-PAN008 TaxID=3243332 RepID=UPI003F742CF0
MTERKAGTRAGALVVRVGDYAGTAVFALEGALAAAAAHFDPVGVLALAFVTSLGGGVMRDVLIGLRPAAIADWRYALIALTASLVVWWALPYAHAVPPAVIVALDAGGLALFAVAGTEKALDHGVHPLPATFLGTLGGVGGGVTRDILLNEVPRILHTDIYASAAFAGAVIVVVARAARIDARVAALVAGAACLAIRLVAWNLDWHLPRL